MNRPLALSLLLAASVAAGFLLWKPAPPAPRPSDDCAAGSSCGIPSDTAEASPAEAEPAQSRAPAGPAEVPETAIDPVQLREDADRLIAEGRVREGVEALRQATYANPTAKNHGDLGSLLERLTIFDEALRHLRAAAELEPGDPDRWVAVANAAYRAVNPGAAWEAERRAREARPGLQLKRGPAGLWLLPSESPGDSPSDSAAGNP